MQMAKLLGVTMMGTGFTWLRLCARSSRRHATSKIDGSDLLTPSFGFTRRGLPALGLAS